MGRKNGSGEGSIYKRGEKWRGQIMIDGNRFSFSSSDKREVINWMSEVRVKYNNRTLVTKDNMTVKELSERWLKRRLEPTVSETTYYKTERLIRGHLYPVLGEYKVQDLTREIIEDAYPRMFEAKQAKKYKRCNYCASTVKLFSSKFKAILKYAVELKILPCNPHDGVVLPKNESAEPVQAYTASEQRKIIDYLTKNPTGANRVFYLLIATGMRTGEALSLTWDDVDLSSGSIKISKTAVNYKGSMLIQDHPKTKQSVRTIYLSANTVKYLRNLKNDDMNFRNLVLANNEGNIYHTSALRSKWIKTCSKLNIPYKGLHALRHSWTTRALEKGIDIKTVSVMLGHSSVVTTMNIYQNVHSDLQKKAAEMMNEVV